MRRNERWIGRRSLLACVLAISMWGASGVHAQTELDTVREMLKLDAERALAQERQRVGEPVRAKTPTVKPPAPESIRVLAIYGMTGRLKADVLVNGERKEFRQGSELPRDGQADDRGYRLSGIDDGCVRLKRDGRSGLKVACIAGGPEVSPERLGVDRAVRPVAGAPFPMAAPLVPLRAFPPTSSLPGHP